MSDSDPENDIVSDLAFKAGAASKSALNAFNAGLHDGDPATDSNTNPTNETEVAEPIVQVTANEEPVVQLPAIEKAGPLLEFISQIFGVDVESFVENIKSSIQQMLGGFGLKDVFGQVAGTEAPQNTPAPPGTDGPGMG